MAEVLLGIALVGGAAATANAIAGRRARHAHAKSEAWALELAHDREGGAGLVWHSINRAVDDVLAHRRAASALAQLEGEAAHALEDAAQRLAIEDERAVVDERVRAAFDGAPPWLASPSEPPSVSAASSSPFDSLNADVLGVVASFLDSASLTAFSLTCKFAHGSLSLDALWDAAFLRDLGTTRAEDAAAHAADAPPGAAGRGRARAAYAAARARLAAARVPAPLFARANALLARFRRVDASLLCRVRPGASVAALAAAEAAHGRPLPAAVRALYHAFDGHADSQSGGFGPGGRCLRPTFLGFISFYSTLVAPYVLPLAAAVRLTAANRAPRAADGSARAAAGAGGAGALHDRFFVFTRNLWGAGGHFVVDDDSGGAGGGGGGADVWAVCAGLRLVRAAPARPPAAADGPIAWLEELARRVEARAYVMERLPRGVEDAIRAAERARPAAGGGDDEVDDEEEDKHDDDDDDGACDARDGAALPLPPALSLFPEPGPAAAGLASSATTAGVTVEMGCVFVPHSSTPGGGVCVDARTGEPPALPAAYRAAPTPEEARRGRYSFAYRARLRYGGDAAAWPAVQLATRAWRIFDGGAREEVVNGPGVIGEFPRLEAGGEPFAYASASSAVTPDGGRMAGSLGFVPGSLAAPAGPAFDAAVAPFALRVPEYLYC